ncbi:MAG: MBL fold metallo-hydrolase [Deinococcales bacterium]
MKNVKLMIGLCLFAIFSFTLAQHDMHKMEVMTESTSLDSGATMTVYNYGNAKIHAYTGGPAANGTYIIEGQNSLVIVDAQFLAPVAQEFRAYADALNKPIDRLIITHEHPDHWFGLGAFADVAIYGSANTKAFLNEQGEDILKARGESMGALPNYVPISHILPQGGEVIDGIRYNYLVYQHAEADEQVVILLPELKVILTGDLVYHNFYLILEANGFDNWMNILASLKSFDYHLILPDTVCLAMRAY